MQFEFLQKLEYEIKYDDIDFPRLFSGPTYYILLVTILELGSGQRYPVPSLPQSESCPESHKGYVCS